MGFIKEFKEFAVKGNMVDMAVGIVIGAAFGKVVTSLVNDVIMPPVGMLLGGTDFKSLQVVLKAAEPKMVNGIGVMATDGNPEMVPEVAIRYGMFINTLIDFAIVALAIFVAIKTMNQLSKRMADGTRRLGTLNPLRGGPSDPGQAPPP